jgi:hypothetical protein
MKTKAKPKQNKVVSKSLLDTYVDELQFLITLKQSVSILHNRIHDKLAYIAIEKLRPLHAKLRFEYAGAGVAGIDIRGYSLTDELRLIAEVKATHTTDTVKLRGPQKTQIKKDLQRLTDEPGDVIRYLVVISQQTKNAVESQLNTAVSFPKVSVIDALGVLDLAPTDEPIEQQ